MKQSQGSRAATEGGDDLVVYASKGRAVGWALLVVALLLLVVISALVGPTDPEGSLVIRVLACLAVTLFFVLLVGVLLVIVSSAPQLMVNREGIWVNSPLVFGTGIVPWSDITGILAIRYRMFPVTQTSLLILLRDKRALRARQNAAQRLLWLLLLNPLMWPQAVVVNDTVLIMSIGELVGRMRIRYGQELARHGIQVQEEAG